MVYFNLCQLDDMIFNVIGFECPFVGFIQDRGKSLRAALMVVFIINSFADYIFLLIDCPS